MNVRFWGTRGSIAAPGAGTAHFGGNTSCVEVTTRGGARLVLDCGTGVRPLGAALTAAGSRPLIAALLLSHTHWDHIQGFPFFAPLFAPTTRLVIYAPRGSGRSLPQVMAGQMEYTYFPVELAQLPAQLTYIDLDEGSHSIAGVRVVAQYLNHPSPALAYRIEADGVTLVYACDHEPFSGTLWRGDSPPGRLESILHAGDRRHAEFMAGADLVIHDAQYTPDEYATRKNWGHSPWEYVVEIASAARVRRVALTHHDPAHDDDAVAEIERLGRALAASRGGATEVLCAYEGCEIPLVPSAARAPARVTDATARPGGSRILIVDDDPELRLLARRALDKDGHSIREASDGAEGLERIADWHPDLIVLDLVMPEMDGLEVLRRLRSEPATKRLPVLILTAHGDETSTRAGFDLGATDYLTKPFSMPQLAARVRACLARAAG